MSDLLQVSTEDGIGVIAINRPARRNALNTAVKAAIIATLETLVADETVSVIVLTGNGGYFVAGSDVAEMASMNAAEIGALQGDRVFLTLRQCPKPVIAAVEGYALGGGSELALACDMIVAAENALFGQPEINLGIMPGAGGTQQLLRAVGKYRAARLSLTGERIDARTAADWGLISELTAPGKALERAMEFARQIAAKSRPATLAVKRALAAGQELPLSQGLKFERDEFIALFDTDEQKAGMKKFLG